MAVLEGDVVVAEEVSKSLDVVGGHTQNSGELALRREDNETRQPLHGGMTKRCWKGAVAQFASLAEVVERGQHVKRRIFFGA